MTSTKTKLKSNKESQSYMHLNFWRRPLSLLTLSRKTKICLELQSWPHFDFIVEYSYLSIL